jgi:hypothetical protein
MDGASFIVPKEKKELYNEICARWCKSTSYSLEETYFKKIFFQNVNSYIAQTTNGKVKKKGNFITSTELHKNKSFRVIALALEKYFIYNENVEDFINNHNNIFDFVGRSSGTKTYYHKDITNDIELPKLLRYYPTYHGRGFNIMKMVKEGNETNAKNASIKPADLPKITCNYLPKQDYEKHLENVNRGWFIQQALEIIRPIELKRKIKKKTIVPKEQLSLF